ncbi:MAG TPA: UMP kinase [Candidatus Methylomirabilis sp.]|nr:UMP kinase [Candidatus Methylomirabilis sp.]
MSVTVLSVGGSLVAPKSGIDVGFLKKFRQLIRREAKKGSRFIIVVGGGNTARTYQRAASSLVRLAAEDVDWLGIHATRLNGHLLRTIFRDIAQHRVVKDPSRPVTWNRPVLIAAGWKPGWSTDYVAVRLARKFGATTVVNLTNTDGVYDRDPSLHEDAQRLDRMDWKSFRKLVGSRWEPGANAPFDPIASRLAANWKMTVIVMQGKSLKNVEAVFNGKRFRGTTIS